MEKRPGSLSDAEHVKYFILYILKCAKSPIPYSSLCDIAMFNGYVNYFDFSEGFTALRDAGLTDMFEDETCAITPLGIDTEHEVSQKIPFTIRQKALYASALIVAKIHRDSLIDIGMVNRDDGQVDMHFEISDGTDKLMDLKLLVINSEQAQILENNFRNHAEEIFSHILKGLTKDFTLE